MFAKEFEGANFSGCCAHFALTKCIDEAIRGVVGNVPLIHFLQLIVGLENSYIGAFCNDVQFAVGDQSRNFNDDILFVV